LTTILRYTPDKEGQFTVQCAELCGYGHSIMLAPVTVMSSDAFESWVAKQVPPSPTPAPTPVPSPGASPTPSAAPSPGTAGGVINVSANNLKFDTDTISAAAGSDVTIRFNNQDTSVPHNIAFYTDATATKPIFTGNIITGPATTTYTFTAPSTPGNYFFRCDVHPTIMTGTFVVN
jgi:heme/copper-type cytochrome/quinol oxidase subunit 2